MTIIVEQSQPHLRTIINTSNYLMMRTDSQETTTSITPDDARPESTLSLSTRSSSNSESDPSALNTVRRVSNSSACHGQTETPWSNFWTGVAVDRRSHGRRRRSTSMASPHSELTSQSDEARWNSDDFSVLRHVGRGHYGVLVKASYKRGRRKLALKQIEKNRILRDRHRGGRSLQLLKREIEIHSRLRHENVVRFYGYFHCPENVHLVLDYARLGNLHNYIYQYENGIVSLDRAILYLQQVTSGLAYLDSMNISHRDIKQENIILTSTNTLQLCDFGWAVQWKEFEKRTTLCGTPLYVPPEMLSENAAYDARYVDWWALGVLAHELILCDSPFDKDEDQSGTSSCDENHDARSHRHEIFSKIRGYNESNLPSWCESNAQSFIENLLQPNPENRMSPKDALRHPFLQTKDNVDAHHFVYKTPSKVVATKETPSSSREQEATCFGKRPLEPSLNKVSFEFGVKNKTWYAPIKRKRL